MRRLLRNILAVLGITIAYSPIVVLVWVVAGFEAAKMLVLWTFGASMALWLGISLFSYAIGEM